MTLLQSRLVQQNKVFCFKIKGLDLWGLPCSEALTLKWSVFIVCNEWVRGIPPLLGGKNYNAKKGRGKGHLNTSSHTCVGL